MRHYRYYRDPCQLTPREQQVCALLVQRYSYREIGEMLALSERRIGQHAGSIYSKLHVTNRHELIALTERATVAKLEFLADGIGELVDVGIIHE